MALLNGLETATKGAIFTLTLDKTALFTLTPISTDEWFSVQENVQFAKVIYKSSEGNQEKMLLFDLSKATPSVATFFSEKARATFDILKIILVDYDGDILTINSGDLPSGLTMQLENLVTFTENASGKQKLTGAVTEMAVQSDGKILVGGVFTNYEGVSGRNNLIRLNADYTLDTDFCANAVDDNKFNYEISALAVQSDGKILVGGYFSDYGGEADRNGLIRLNSDGTLDTTFMANAVDGNKFNYGGLESIAVQSDGKILVGGDFEDYGITNRSYLVRLNSDGTLDTAFCTNASNGRKFNNYTTSVAVQSDGKILVGGWFTNYGALGRHRFIRLNANGTLDTAFCANASNNIKFNDGVYGIAVQSDGKILVGGDFTDYAGTAGRNYVVRLNSDGTTDTAFCANAVDGQKFEQPLAFPNTITVQSDGKILVGGQFSNYDGVLGRNYLIRLNSDGTLDTAFCANAVDGSKFNFTVRKTRLDSNNNIYVGGEFNSTPYPFFAILDSNGNVKVESETVTGTITKFAGEIFSLAVQSDGKILASGSFFSYGQESGRNGLIRLNSDGTLDTAFCANASDNDKFNFGSGGTIYSVAVESDGKILVGGWFTGYDGTTGRNYLIRLNSDGTLDTAFCANASDGNKFNGAVFSMAIQSDGKILVGGQFSAYGGISGRNNLIRLNSDGTRDEIFDMDGKFNDSIQSIAVQSDGKILVGGQFYDFNGTVYRNNLVRLTSEGVLDGTFCTNAVDGGKFSGTITSIAVQSDGKILVGGGFTNYAGTIGRDHLVRLNSDGTTDTAFCANAVDDASFNSSGEIRAIKTDLENNIYIGGYFADYKILSRNYLVKLNSDGTVNSAFCAAISDNGKISDGILQIQILNAGQILIGGAFIGYDGFYNKLIQIKNNAIS